MELVHKEFPFCGVHQCFDFFWAGQLLYQLGARGRVQPRILQFVVLDTL